MKIAVYANELTSEKNTGVKIYTREIIKGLSEIDRENQYVVYLNDKTGLGGNEVSYLKDKQNFSVKLSKSRMPFWTYMEFGGKIQKDTPDVLFMPIQSVPFFKKPRNLRIVATIHDTAYLLFPSHFTAAKRRLLHFHTRRTADMSDAVIVPSNATKENIMRFYNVPEEKINVVYHGVMEYHGKSDDETTKRIQNYKPYLLYVGSIQPRKNIVSLIKAFEGLREKDRHPLKLLICGGRGWMFEKTLEAAQKSKFSNDIVFTGNVQDQELHELYKGAMVFVMPSLYEGFGLPVVEAMSEGVPCVISYNSSLKEIAEDSAVFFNASDASDIENKLRSVIENEQLRKELAEKGRKTAKKFNWEISARRHLKIFLK